MRQVCSAWSYTQPDPDYLCRDSPDTSHPVSGDCMLLPALGFWQTQAIKTNHIQNRLESVKWHSLQIQFCLAVHQSPDTVQWTWLTWVQDKRSQDTSGKSYSSTSVLMKADPQYCTERQRERRGLTIQNKTKMTFNGQKSILKNMRTKQNKDVGNLELNQEISASAKT